ncbi:glycosyltransferase [Liquorilactobacillus mali]|uniref:glycosyltransferase family 32 protein n=1 Tax=Liquorilactobacillus mali TaxID=1618 RepID=UPI00264E7597|nr:glycosyltransferase [Liquorilactobacillus mali]MDN7145536.1 glycosyltransferase [Liquorilactobacillus mali]
MIPTKIHYCWFGGKELPEEYKKYIAKWRELCPEYEIIQWDESNYDVKKNKYMKQAYDRKKWSFVSDYAGFDIVYQNGGIYLDTDVELKKSLDDLLKTKAFMGMEENEGGVSVNPGLGFGAEPKNQVIKDLRDIYDTVDFIKKDGEMNIVAIPVYTTNYFAKKGLLKKNEYQNIAGVDIYPTEYFAPMDFLTGESNETKNTISIHHYSALWQDERSQKHTKIIRSINRRFGKKIGMKINWFFRVSWGLARRIRRMFNR